MLYLTNEARQSHADRITELILKLMEGKEVNAPYLETRDIIKYLSMLRKEIIVEKVEAEQRTKQTVVKLDGLVKILFRDFGWLGHTKEEIKEHIERDGIAYFDSSIKYLGFNEFDISEYNRKKGR